MRLFCSQLTGVLLANSCNVRYKYECSFTWQGDPGINRTWIVVSSWKWSVQVLILISFLKLNLEGFLLR
jgi:hypothetical protein